MAGDGDNVDRTSVRTYVPAYQKEIWQDHADELGMSQSEFVRTMVQAGRSGFEPQDSEQSVDEPGDAEERDIRDATPGVDGVKDRVLGVLDDDTYYDWDQLVAELTDDIEQQLEEILQELQAEGTVTYSGRHGGYVLNE